MLLRGEQVLLQISGDSMRPTLKPRRDAALLAPITRWPTKRGDILYFRSERSASGYALHRVFKVSPEGVYMNGDAQNWVEGPIPKDAVLAVAVALIKKGKPFNIENPLYKAYVFLWRFTRRVRFQLFALWRKIKHSPD